MKDPRPRSFEPTCQIHEGFFINAVYIQDEDYQGYLSKRLSPSLMEGFCTCVDRSMDPQPSNDCELSNSPAPPYDFEPDPDDVNQTSTMSTYTEGHCILSPSVSLYDEDGQSRQATTVSRSSSVSPSCENSDSKTPPSPAPETIPETRFLRSTRMRPIQTSSTGNLSDMEFFSTNRRARKRLPSCGPLDASPKRRRLSRPGAKSSVTEISVGSRQCKSRGRKERRGGSLDLPAELSDSEDTCRAARDKFLVEKRLLGLPYSEIKALGKFREAESTLRGRYRTLTKDREERVRKPQWTEEDMELLPSAVKQACEGKNPDRTHVPWERVATILHEIGGSYRFGSGACHKMWDMLQTGRTD